ncbi:alkaline phosphatase D family protein [Salicola sp. Rm-C-2C1-2]|uniref:alkaline phosphatase D family protein n=1 Tax=Salicola sp. Rm-C-2C1-2 TaxID=3141321 RepID=UPI0032E45F8D
MGRLTRRDFIRGSAYALGAFAVSSSLQGCLDSSDQQPARFEQGVASGDPLQDRVIIWTRAVPLSSGANEGIEVNYEVAEDEAFTNVIRNGSQTVTADHDYTLKVDVQRLKPGKTYFYRFSAGGNTSETGKTRTLPEGSVDQVRLAVVSCSNYPAGYFHAYGEIAKESELDAFVHLGDYLYEYGAGEYATEDAQALGRVPDPAKELITLADYRARYAQYRSDGDLKTLHRTLPMIAVWDDHEVANDAWRKGAENHEESDGEGDYAVRKREALQAYFEWMPVRPVQANDQAIYRSFDFGNLVSLHMLDTRIIGREEPYALGDFVTDQGFDGEKFAAQVGDENRTLLGAEQLNWLKNRMGGSNATWQVLGQQVLMGRMEWPAELLTQGPDPESLSELATIKQRILNSDESVTKEEKARVQNVLPYNLDAWDGYIAERERVLGTALKADKNLVVLAGDTHNAWANDLTTGAGENVGAEFATSSISSPGLESYLKLAENQIPSVEAAFQLLIDNLRYTNVSQRGYMVVTFTEDNARADWRFVTTIKADEYSVDQKRAKSLQIGAGEKQVKEV